MSSIDAIFGYQRCVSDSKKSIFPFIAMYSHAQSLTYLYVYIMVTLMCSKLMCVPAWAKWSVESTFKRFIFNPIYWSRHNYDFFFQQNPVHINFIRNLLTKNVHTSPCGLLEMQKGWSEVCLISQRMMAIKMFSMKQILLFTLWMFEAPTRNVPIDAFVPFKRYCHLV